MNRHEAYVVLGKIMAINDDTVTATQIIAKGIEVCKSTVELQFALCAIAFMENKNKEGELLLRNLLEHHFSQHELLYDFNEDLVDNIFINNILAEYN
jgi:hypothetical protein